MFTPDLASVDFREASDLPKNTIIAPLPVIREIRLVLGKINIDMQVGAEDAVLVSSDVFAAFSEWDAAQVDFDEEDGEMPGEDSSLLN